MQFLCYVWLQKAFRANMLMISSGKFSTISTKINHNNPNIFETNFFFVDFIFIYFIRKTKFTVFCQFLQSFVKISLHRWFVSNALPEASYFRISMWKLLIFFLRIKRKCRIDAVSSLWREQNGDAEKANVSVHKFHGHRMRFVISVFDASNCRAQWNLQMEQSNLKNEPCQLLSTFKCYFTAI